MYKIYFIVFSQRSGWSPAPAGFAPSIDWQVQQVADFADVRQVVLLPSLINISSKI